MKQTLEFQAPQSVPVHVCACTYMQISKVAALENDIFKKKELPASNPLKHHTQHREGTYLPALTQNRLSSWKDTC